MSPTREELARAIAIAQGGIEYFTVPHPEDYVSADAVLALFIPMYAEGAKPPGREWAPLWDRAFADPDKVRERMDGEPGTIIRRYVTEWEPVDE